VQSRANELRPGTIATLGYRLKVFVQGREKVPLEAYPWMQAWTDRIATQSVDTQRGTRSALHGFATYCVRQGILGQVRSRGLLGE
jgi:hypothetical protein